MGHTVLSINQDCNVCEECAKTPNHHFKTCISTGTKCRRDADCREDQKCLRSLSVNVEGKRCHAAPFNCKGYNLNDVHRDGLEMVPRLREWFRQVEAEVISNSRNKLHQTTYKDFFSAL